MLAREVPTGREWVYELKLDGFRGTLYIDDGRGVFRSKRKNVMRRFQQLADNLAATLRVKNAILDGEIIVTDKRGMPDFYALMFRRGDVVYAAFDLVWLNGKDLRKLRYSGRKRRLQRLLRAFPTVAVVPSHDDPALLDAVVRLDLEGIVAKRRRDPYAPDVEWIKVKHAGYSQMEGRSELFARR